MARSDRLYDAGAIRGLCRHWGLELSGSGGLLEGGTGTETVETAASGEAGTRDLPSARALGSAPPLCYQSGGGAHASGGGVRGAAQLVHWSAGGGPVGGRRESGEACCWRSDQNGGNLKKDSPIDLVVQR